MSTASKVGTAFEFKDKMTLEKVLSRAAEDGTKALIPKTYVAPWEQEVRCAVLAALTSTRVQPLITIPCPLSGPAGA